MPAVLEAKAATDAVLAQWVELHASFIKAITDGRSLITQADNVSRTAQEAMLLYIAKREGEGEDSAAPHDGEA